VFLTQFEFGGQLLSGLELARLDLLAQILGDLPVDGSPSARLATPCPPVGWSGLSGPSVPSN
jgi:hypothetical protein